MKEVVDKILEQVEADIFEIDLYGYDIIETSLSMVHKLQTVLDDLRTKIQTYVFPTKEDEILFFKTQKPEILGRLLFFYKIYKIETQCPNGSDEVIRNYINRELDNLTYFFNRNLDFYQYYRSHSTVYDEYYFVRGKADLRLCTDSAQFDKDPNFSTGYDYNTEFTPSSHILEVLAKRPCVLAKKTAEGEMTCYPLHDENRNKYADSENVENATDAVLTGSEGEVYVYEPHYWYKGVTDVLNQCLYGFISSNEDAPAAAGYTSVKFTREELDVTEGIGIRKNTDYTTIEEAKNEYESGSFALVDVRDYKQVRFPGLASTLYGAVFIDDTGKIVSRVSVSNANGFINGMYLFCAVPVGATKLAFTFLNSATFDFVLLTTSESVEAIEPDWVEHTECLGGAYEAYLIDDVLRSVSGVSSVGTISQAQAIKYAQNRGKGFQLFDWEMHKDVGNLHFFKYGNTDSQGVCGYGTNNYQKVTGLTNALGIRDTVSYYKEKGGSNPQAEGAYRDGVNYQSVNVLGYENFQGNKAEWLQYVTVNKTAADGRWFITMPDGTERVVQGITVYNADIYPTHMVWGRYMDLIAAKEGGSTSSHWFDRFYVGTGLSRVVYRSYSSAYALGGVSYAFANHDSSNTNASIGVRLAFRGIIRWAGSVAAFKAINQAD